MSGKLVLIDGHSILNRAFFGIPDLTNSEGLHTNAIYGFLNIMFKILEEEAPDYLTVAFDVHAPTFRHKMFDAYKGTRKPMAEELRQQVPVMKEMLRAMGVTIMEKEGYEADDLIGTMARIGEEEGLLVAVVSGDRDLLQLATDHTMIRIPKTKKTGTEIENYFAADVKEKYSVTPKEFIDVKALMGDTADNIPGVPGIGEKTATTLIATYGSIEAVHEHAKEVKPPRAAKNIVEFWDQAVMSKTLATIDTHAEIEYSLSDARLTSTGDLYTDEAYLMCKRLEFKNLLSRFQVSPVTNKLEDHFEMVTCKEKAEEILQRAKGKEVGFSIVGDSKSKPNQVFGVAFAFSGEEVYYLSATDEISGGWLVEQLEELQKSEHTRLITSGLKEQLKYTTAWDQAKSCVCDSFFDITIAAYLLNPLKNEYPFDDMAKDYCGLYVPSQADLLGKKTKAELATENPKALFLLGCYEAVIAYLAKAKLVEALEETQMLTLYKTMEMPLVFVLDHMEKEGIYMDTEALKEYGESLGESIAVLEQKIYKAAGEPFNINSPKQLGVILFEKLGLPNGKKTKTGYSTSAEVLESLAKDYPIVADVLEYRQLSKLKSTYADGLVHFVDENQKIHTTFHQTITATGRLSSADPNLQNIPIRIELGKMIRKVFYPKTGSIFVDSDYSQIELRILASMSGDETLIQAYQNNQDIHATTASQVFHVPFDEVTPELRRNAKAVNFGIVYGISAFGLSQDLGISKKEAGEYIDRYFEVYPKIKEFLEQCVADAKENGYTITAFGRRRPIPELSASNFMQRQFGERVAMNAPIQGTAADIIKIAMIRVHDRLLEEKMESRILLQVHDELLIEAKEEEKDKVMEILGEEMTKAADFAVTLEIDTQLGNNWYEAH